MKKTKSKEKKLNLILDAIQKFLLNIVDKIYKFLTNKKHQKLLISISRVLCCLVFLWVLKIPVAIIDKIGEGIIYLCNFSLTNLMMDLWSFIIYYVYYLVVLILLKNTILDMSKRKEYSFSIKGSVKKGKELYEYVLVALKTIIGFISVPLVLFAMFFFAMIGINLAMIKNGIYVIGPMMILIGFLVIIVAALLKLLDILFYDKDGDK